MIDIFFSSLFQNILFTAITAIITNYYNNIKSIFSRKKEQEDDEV